MPRIVFRPKTNEDLAKLYRYVARRSDSPEIAINHLRRVRTRCDPILAFPESGRRRDDLRTGIRTVGFERRVVIVYAILASGDVEIERIFYGGRDYEAILSDDSQE